MKNFYQLLGVSPTATAEEIKRAFRQEIARYHPDKVQHLGKEFQELAGVRAADLTQAYQVLMDPKQRTDYNERLQAGDAGTAAPPPPPRPSAEAAPPPSPAAARAEGAAPATAEPVAESAARPTPGRDEFMRKVAIGKFREAVLAALGGFETLSIKGFDLACVSKPRRSLFKKSPPPTRVLARFVARVDSASIEETWPLAAKSGPADPEMSVCAFVLGAGLAPPRELASAITEQRKRRSRSGSRVVMIPVDVRDWEALVPTDAPAAVKLILETLKAS